MSVASSVHARQSGWALTEVMVALALAILLALWQAGGDVARMRDARARAAGHWLLQVRLAVDEMLRTHYDALSMGTMPRTAQGQPAFVRPLAPTLEELRRAGHLPAAFSTVSALGFLVHVAIEVAPACPEAACRLDAVIGAVLPTGAAWQGSTDERAIISQALGGYALQIRAAHPSHWRGSLLKLRTAARVGGMTWPVGSMGAWAGVNRSGMLAYLRVGDTRDPDFKGPVTVAGALHTAAHIQAGSWLRSGLEASPGMSCAVPGAMARDGAGQALSCLQGIWRHADGGFGGAYSKKAGMYCVTAGPFSDANPRTGACTCPAGYRAIKVYSESFDWYWERQNERAAWVCVR